MRTILLCRECNGVLMDVNTEVFVKRHRFLGDKIKRKETWYEAAFRILRGKCPHCNRDLPPATEDRKWLKNLQVRVIATEPKREGVLPSCARWFRHTTITAGGKEHQPKRR